MLRWFNQKGEGKAGCIFGLVLLASACFFAYKVIPVKVRATEMADAVTDEARAAGGRSQAALRRSLAIKAQNLGLPITEQDIKITRSAQFIKVEVEYTIAVEFPGYTYNWKFHPIAENPVF